MEGEEEGVVEVVVEEAPQGHLGDHSQIDEQQVTIVIGTEFTTITLMVPLT